MSFKEVWHHRLKYMLTPQLDLYKHINQYIDQRYHTVTPEEPGFARQHVYVLDYGCGTGFGSIQMRVPGTQTVDGLDSDITAIRFAIEVFGQLVDFNLYDFENANPTKRMRGRYDVVTCIEVLEHVERPDVVLSRIHDVMTEDGIAICSTLNHNSQYRKNDDHKSPFTVESFRKLLEAEFNDVHMTDYMLNGCLDTNSTITPIVGIVKK